MSDSGFLLTIHKAFSIIQQYLNVLGGHYAGYFSKREKRKALSSMD
jgi:hypothetical protein